jgi:hypothetical protein
VDGKIILNWILTKQGLQNYNFTFLYQYKTWPFTQSKAAKHKVLRRIFGPEKEEETELKLYNEKLHHLYSWPCIIKVIKSTRMSWEEHLVLMKEIKNVYKILIGKSKKNDTTKFFHA